MPAGLCISIVEIAVLIRIAIFVSMIILLAIDLGVRTGWATYDENGFLIDFGSHNYGNAGRLKKAAYPFLRQFTDLQYLIIEGGGKLTKYWKNAAHNQSIKVIQTHAHVWRDYLFRKKHITHTNPMKKHAEDEARGLIEKSNLSQPKNITHDAAEAILTGYWACKKLGWLKK